MSGQDPPNLVASARHGYVLSREHGRASKSWPDGKCHGFSATAGVHRHSHFGRALAWQDVRSGNLTILDKNGGLPNTSTWIGFTPQRHIGVVLLCNPGKQPATKIGRQILHALARDQSQPSTEGEPDPNAN